MIALSWLVMQMEITKPEQFWPATVTGWITIASILASTVWIIFQVGRWSQKLDDHKREVTGTLNAFGARVTKVELGYEHESGRVDAVEVQLSRTQGQYETLIAILSEAKENVAQFREGTLDLGDKIAGQIEQLRKEQGETKLHLSERLKAVETILEHRNG